MSSIINSPPIKKPKTCNTKGMGEQSMLKQCFVNKMLRTNFNFIIQNIQRLNPHIQHNIINKLIHNTTFNNNGNIQDLNLNGLELNQLPDDCWELEIDGDVDLSCNNLETLPYGFEKIKIKGSLNCSNNKIHSLNKDFYKISVLTNINLSKNNLSELPESFSKLIVRGNLNLSNNKLENVALYNIPSVIRKSLYINDNIDLTTLPYNFSNMIIGEDFEFYNCNIRKIEKPLQWKELIFIGGKLLKCNNSINIINYITKKDFQ